MTFDPFGDFDQRGYLRNVARTKDPKIVRQMEHSSFMTGLDAAFTKLAAQKRLSLTTTSLPRIRFCSKRCIRGRVRIA